MNIKSDMMGGDPSAAERVSDIIARATGVFHADDVDTPEYQAAMSIAQDTNVTNEERITLLGNLWDEEGLNPGALEELVQLVPQMEPRYLDPNTNKWVDGLPPNDAAAKAVTANPKLGADDKVGQLIKAFPRRPTPDQILDLYNTAKELKSNKLMNFVKSLRAEGKSAVSIIGMSVMERRLQENDEPTPSSRVSLENTRHVGFTEHPDGHRVEIRSHRETGEHFIYDKRDNSLSRPNWY